MFAKHYIANVYRCNTPLFKLKILNTTPNNTKRDDGQYWNP